MVSQRIRGPHSSGLWKTVPRVGTFKSQPTPNSSLLVVAAKWDGPGRPLSTSFRNAALGGAPHPFGRSFPRSSQGYTSPASVALRRPSVPPFPAPDPHLTPPGLDSISPSPPSAHAPPDSEGCERIGLRPRGGAAPASRSCSDAAVAAALRSPASTRTSSAVHSLPLRPVPPRARLS